jgi:hypothetical protein
MKPREIFAKTMPFCWAKLLLGLATIVISVIVFAILMLIAANEIMLLIWVAITAIVNFVLNRYIGYLVKAGHVAVITEAVVSGNVPDNQIAYGKQMVKERFATSNVYFVLDRLVSGAVRQLQNGFERVGNTIGRVVPGMGAVVGIGKIFIGIALGYIDECCLGYTFLKKDQGAFKSAADGVVIYAQNWKKLLKDAAKTTAMVVLLVIVSTIVTFILFMSLFRLFGWDGWRLIVAFLISCFVSWVIKSAFIDSYTMIRVMVSYMQEAPTTVITFDLYGKLCGLSRKFKSLFDKGQKEAPSSAGQPAYAAAGTPQPNAPAGTAGDKPAFCGECGARNEAGIKFCGSCGKPLT